MIKTDYFYRRIQTSQFVQTKEQKRIIPVRLKTPFTELDEWFCEERGVWLPLASVSEQGITGADGTHVRGIPEEFVESPDSPKEPVQMCEKYHPGYPRTLSLEELDAGQMESWLLFRRNVRRSRFNKTVFRDSDGIQKDFAAAALVTDTDSLTLTIRFYKFTREEKRSQNGKPEIPRLEERELVFDMKNGKARIPLEWERESGVHVDDIQGDTYKEYDWRREKDITKRVTPRFRYEKTTDALAKLERLLPHTVLEAAFGRLTELASAFTGVKLQPANPEKNGTLCALYRLTVLPFAPDLCEVLFSEEFEERRVRFSYKRTDSKVFKRFCRKMKIRNTKTLRKCYLRLPRTLLTAMRLRECGFKDMNLYNRVIESKENEVQIAAVDRTSLAFFARFSIKKRGQKATMNTLLKGAGVNDRYRDTFLNFSDGLDMFAKYFKHVPDTLRQDILEDGFTKFNHDALSNLAWQYENKNITFTHTAEEKRLEDTIDGYEFRLPEDSYRLCEIGTSLHNCVASYADDVEQKKCTIVYATKDGDYALCIEVRGNEVWQERADHNAPPSKEAQDALDKWRERHRLVLG